ncbi:MAG: hypothetical protein V1784_10725 [bacterium]
MSMKKQLQDVHERIMAVKYPDKSLSELLPHELLPIIEENEILKNEYDRRLYYYERLAKDPSYLALVENIHKEMEAIQKLIDPSKLPDTPRLFKPKRNLEINEPWIEMKELHKILDQEEKWWHLGSVNSWAVGDCVRCPWKAVIRQYEIVMALFDHALYSEALDGKKAGKNLAALKDHLKDLERRLERPSHRLHINDFDYVDRYMHSPHDMIRNEEKEIDSVKKRTDRVCKDLLLILEEQEEAAIKPIRTLVQLPALSQDEQRKRELLKVYDEVLKKFDLKSFREKYADNPVISAIIRRITSPEFLRMVGRGIEERKRWNQQFEKAYGEEMKKLSAQSDALKDESKKLHKEAERARDELHRMFTAHQPDLERLQNYSTQAAKALTRDLDAIEAVTTKITEPLQAVSGAVQRMIQTPIVYAPSLAVEYDQGHETVLSLPKPIQPHLRPDQVIISYAELLRAVEVSRGLFSAHKQTEPIENHGSQDVINVRGVRIDKERQEVIYRDVRSAFKLGGVPWTMIRLCTEDGEDGIGRTDVDSFLKKRTKDALHRIVNRMNKPWRDEIGENIFRIHNDCFCVDPQPVRGVTPQRLLTARVVHA